MEGKNMIEEEKLEQVSGGINENGSSVTMPGGPGNSGVFPEEEQEPVVEKLPLASTVPETQSIKIMIMDKKVLTDNDISIPNNIVDAVWMQKKAK